MRVYCGMPAANPRTLVNPALFAAEKIGEGQYREVFRSGPFALKLLKKFRVRERWRHAWQLPLQPYVEEKYGIEDLNQHEFENYRKLAEVAPADLRGNFCIVHWAGYHQGHSVSLSDLTVNDDGGLAQPLVREGRVLDPEFWRALNKIEALLLDTGLFFTGINPDNILVRKKDGVTQPVIVDYKWLGREAYPLQFWLRCRAGLVKKIAGKFETIRLRFKPN